MRHLLEPEDLTIEEIDYLIGLANDIIENPEEYVDICRGKLLASLFFEPSTRTRLSFESAMNRLGGRVVGFADPSATSQSKGETLTDTLKIIEQYVDIFAMRHPQEGAPYLVKKYVDIPIINAGDGGHQHPTQTLTDLLTIHHYKGDFNNLTIGMVGDLKYGRTVHSLVNAMKRYKNIKFIFISPEELAMPSFIKDELNSEDYIETDNLLDNIKDLDILYMTRIQKERFDSYEEYLKYKGVFVLNEEKLNRAKDDLIIMHPLPRVDEIPEEVDRDSRAVYFNQAGYGMYIRMALILFLLEIHPKNFTPPAAKPMEDKKIYHIDKKCSNSHCITQFQNIVDPGVVVDSFGKYRCEFCNEEVL